MGAERRPVTHQPQVPERVDEAALPVRAPRHLVGADGVDAAVRTRVHRARDERVRVVDEHLDADGPAAQRLRRVPAVAFRLTEEERCPADREPHHGTEVPQDRRAERLPVPAGGGRRVGDGEHHRDHGRVDGHGASASRSRPISSTDRTPASAMVRSSSAQVLQHRAGPVRAGERQAVDPRPADEHGRRAERERGDDVGAAADAAVEQDGDRGRRPPSTTAGSASSEPIAPST